MAEKIIPTAPPPYAVEGGEKEKELNLTYLEIDNTNDQNNYQQQQNRGRSSHEHTNVNRQLPQLLPPWQSPIPVVITCPICHVEGFTKATRQVDVMAYVMFGLCALCCDCLQDVEHRCSNCNTVVGVYRQG